MQGYLQLESSVKLFDVAFAITKSSFCGALLKRILTCERAFPKDSSSNEIVPVLVTFHLVYS